MEAYINVLCLWTKQSDHQQIYQFSHISLFLLCLGHQEYKGHHMLIDLPVCVGNKEFMSTSYQKSWLFYFIVVTLYLKCLKKYWSIFTFCFFFHCHPSQQTSEFSKCFPCHLLPSCYTCSSQDTETTLAPWH